MNSYRNSTSLLPFAVILLNAVFLISAHAGPRDLVIRGAMDTVETHTGSFPVVALQIDGVGHATLLGRFGLRVEGSINFITRTGTGTAEITAANGDVIRANVAGQATPTGNLNEVSVVEILTVTGGTGRFSSASGTIRVERLVDQLALVSTGTIDGMIHLP